MSITYRVLLLASLLLVGAAGVTLMTAMRSRGSAESTPASRAVQEVAGTDAQIDTLQGKLRRDPSDASALAQLGEAYLQKSRETGDTGLYASAEEALRRALEDDPQNPDALRGLASVANARHDFAQGRDLAQRSLDSDPDNPRTYGVLGDALIELGNYDDAIVAFQHMLDLKPDLSAYARASYVRELHGDVDGAIAAMRMAVDAGGAKGEAVAWAHLQLGHLYLTYGDIDAAEQQYTASLEALPGYVHGQAGLANVHASRGDTASAIAAYRSIVQRYPVLEYIVPLADLYAQQGDASSAREQYELVDVVAQLMRSNGVNSDLELALYYADHDLRLDDALTQARVEYARRPSVHAADILSWTLYKNGLFEEAAEYSDQALQLGSRDPLLAFHAGMIKEELGKFAEARTLLTSALNTNAHASLTYADVARETLARLVDQG